jgi:hypothetical protein
MDIVIFIEVISYIVKMLNKGFILSEKDLSNNN